MLLLLAVLSEAPIFIFNSTSSSSRRCTNGELKISWCPSHSDWRSGQSSTHSTGTTLSWGTGRLGLTNWADLLLHLCLGCSGGQRGGGREARRSGDWGENKVFYSTSSSTHSTGTMMIWATG